MDVCSQLLLVTYSVYLDSQGFIIFLKYFVCVHLNKDSYAHMGWYEEINKMCMCNIPLHSVFYNLHVAVFGLLCFILGVLPFAAFYLTNLVENIRKWFVRIGEFRIEPLSSTSAQCFSFCSTSVNHYVTVMAGFKIELYITDITTTFPKVKLTGLS